MRFTCCNLGKGHMLMLTSHIVSQYIFPCGGIYHFMLAYIYNNIWVYRGTIWEINME